MVGGCERGQLVAVDRVKVEEPLDVARHLLRLQVRPRVGELLEHADRTTPIRLA